jgi:putative transposase
MEASSNIKKIALNNLNTAGTAERAYGLTERSQKNEVGSLPF